MRKLNFLSKVFTMVIIGLMALFSTSKAQLAAGKSKYLGNIIGSSIPSNFSTYWNQVTPENAGKWGSVEATMDQMNWTQLDQAYNFAKSNGYTFKLHTLIWGSQYPSWLTSLSTADQQTQILQWFQALATRYPDVDLIDVVNEPTKTAVPFKDAMGGDGTTGWDWVIWAYQHARQYFPNAKLLINEYGIANDPTAADNYLQVINLLIDRGLLDGIGLQCHYFNLDYTSASQMQATLDKFAATGLPIYISEMDITGVSGTSSEALQAQKYQEIFPVLWEHPDVAGITLWGYIVGQTWRSGTGIVNSDGSELAAMTWLKQYMGGTSTVPVTGVSISPDTMKIYVGAIGNMTATVTPSNATNKNVSWSIGNTNIATVSSSGLVTGVALGNTTVTATTADGGFTASAVVEIGSTSLPVTGVTVTPTSASVAAGGTTTLTAVVSPSNASNKNVSWSTSDATVATVSSGGVVTGVAQGSATIIVTTEDGGFTASSDITVTGGGPTPCVNPVSVTLPFTNDGSGNDCYVTSGDISYINSWNMQTVEINGADFTNVWSNSMPARINGNYYIHYVANVAWAHLEINGTGGGTGNVPVTGVAVAPTSASVNVGGTTTLTATVSPGDATDMSVSWSSSNTSVATVNSSGVVTGVAAGSTTMTVTTTDGGFTASSTVTVGTTNVPVTGVTVTSTSASVATGGTTSLTATVSPSDATDKSVSWSTSDAAIATVSSGGVVTGVAAGTATITVTTTDGGFTASSVITVTGGNPVPCNNPVTITIPFSQDGAGEYCWVTSQSIAYINSWNMDLLEVNGVDFTNVYASSLPAPISGNYYIHYVGSVPWAHFEAPATKGAETFTDNVSGGVRVYPVPFKDQVFVDISGLKNVTRVELLNVLGQVILDKKIDQSQTKTVRLDIQAPGKVFILNVETNGSYITRKLVRK